MSRRKRRGSHKSNQEKRRDKFVHGSRKYHDDQRAREKAAAKYLDEQRIARLAADIAANQQRELPCSGCGAVLKLHKSKAGFFHWKCVNWPECDVRSSAHGNGDPLGTPGSLEVRHARKRAHDVFDRLWKKGTMTRSRAYYLLAWKLGIDRGDCHIGMFNVEQCNRVVEVFGGQRPTEEAG